MARTIEITAESPKEADALDEFTSRAIKKAGIDMGAFLEGVPTIDVLPIS